MTDTHAMLRFIEYKNMRLFYLQNSLAEVISLQHSHETFGGVVYALGDVQLGLEAAICEPLLHRLLVLLEVRGSELGLAHEEPLHGDELRYQLEYVLDAIFLVRWRVVSRDL